MQSALRSHPRWAWPRLSSSENPLVLLRVPSLARPNSFARCNQDALRSSLLVPYRCACSLIPGSRSLPLGFVTSQRSPALPLLSQPSSTHSCSCRYDSTALTKRHIVRALPPTTRTILEDSYHANPLAYSDKPSVLAIESVPSVPLPPHYHHSKTPGPASFGLPLDAKVTPNTGYHRPTTRNSKDASESDRLQETAFPQLLSVVCAALDRCILRLRGLSENASIHHANTRSPLGSSLPTRSPTHSPPQDPVPHFLPTRHLTKSKRTP